jgi:hypothetical protein
MRFSKDFSHSKDFFARKKRLSDNQALFFVLAESLLLAFIVIQLYFLLGIQIVSNRVLFFSSSFSGENLFYFLGSIALLIIGYLFVVLRDETVFNIHKYFSFVLFFETHYKVTNSRRRVILFVLGELAFATILAFSIFLFLDPEIDLNYPDGEPVPFLIKAIAFIIFLGISLLLFSHTKEFRQFFYGSTPLHEHFHFGRHSVVRSRGKATSVKFGTKKTFIGTINPKRKKNI